MKPHIAALLAGMCSFGAQVQPPGRELVVEAGAFDRSAAVTFFRAEGLAPGRQYLLQDANTSIPLQVDASGRGWFVAAALNAGASRTFRIVDAPGSAPAVVASRAADDVSFTVNGAKVPAVQYVGGAGALPSADIKPIFKRGGYLHPVRTPLGKIVTDDYPADHRHHHGIWFAWTKTAFQGREPDFWNMGDAKGRVEFAALNDTWSGPVHGGLRAQHRYVDLTGGAPAAVLDERWETRVFAASAGSRPAHVFDVEVAQTNVAADPLLLPEHHYGGIGVRGAASFTSLDNLRVLTAERRDRLTGDGAESRWAVMSGTVDGAIVSLAVLAHPANFRAPERMRIHPTDPYLCFAPSRSGPWAIGKGATHQARYRFVSFDGAPNAAELSRLWRDYAQPPAASVR